jgi:hypothetical protein
MKLLYQISSCYTFIYRGILDRIFQGKKVSYCQKYKLHHWYNMDCFVYNATGFTKYLLSEECDIFEPLHRTVYQNMRHPLTHYFISTSHNTYLLEDQLSGPSSVEGYIRALGNGCRCIKGRCFTSVDPSKEHVF